MLLTTREVAVWNRESESSVRRHLRSGQLKGVKRGRSYLVTIEAVREWSGFPDVTVEDVQAALATQEAKRAL